MGNNNSERNVIHDIEVTTEGIVLKSLLNTTEHLTCIDSDGS